MKYTKEDLKNTKVRIKSPEHSEYIQKLVFSLGGSWCTGDSCVYKSEEHHIYISGGLTLTQTSKWDWNFFEEHPFKEIEIPLPKDNEEAKILKDESMSSKVSNIGNVLHNMACSENDESIQNDLEGYAHYLWEVSKLLPCEEDIPKTSSAVKAMNKLGYKYCEEEQAWYKEIKGWV